MSVEHCELDRGTAARESDVSIGLLENAREYLVALSRGVVPAAPSVLAWGEFYSVVHPLLLRFASTCRVADPEVDDCVQQVWVELVVKLRDFQHDARRGQFRTWLYTLVHSRATDLTRRAARRRAIGLPDDPESHPPDPAPGPPARCDSRSRMAEMLLRLNTLQGLISAPNARILQMRWIEGYSVLETADALDLTTDQVRFRSHRLRKKIRAVMQDPKSLNTK